MELLKIMEKNKLSKCGVHHDIPAHICESRNEMPAEFSGRGVGAPCSNENGKETVSSEETVKCACADYWGILLSLASGLASTFSGIFVKCLKGFHPFSLATFRYQGILVPTFLMVLYYTLAKKENIFDSVLPLSDKDKRKKFAFTIVRAIVGSVGLFLNFYSLQLIPLADSRVILSCRPVFVIFAARIFLGEPCGIFPVFAAMLTTVGVGIIARPPIFTGEDNFDMDSVYGTIFATLSMLATTLSMVVLRYLKDVHVSVITFAYGFLGTVLSIICSTITGHLDVPQYPKEWFLLCGLTMSAFCSQTAITLAMKYERAGAIVIVRTCDTIMSFILQYMILGVVPDIYSLQWPNACIVLRHSIGNTYLSATNLSRAMDPDYSGYKEFVSQLYDQWLSRETWCAVSGLVPEKERRHYPHKWQHDVHLLHQKPCKGPYRIRSGYRPVYFPPPRRMFPELKNRSCLTGQF